MPKNRKRNRLRLDAPYTAKSAAAWLGELHDAAQRVRAEAEEKAAELKRSAERRAKELARIADSVSEVPADQMEAFAERLSWLDGDALHLRVALVGGRYRGEDHAGCGPFADAQQLVARFLAEAERLSQSTREARSEYFAELR